MGRRVLILTRCRSVKEIRKSHLSVLKSDGVLSKL